MATDAEVEAAWVALGQRCAATPVGSPDFQKVTRLIQVSKDDLRAALEAAEKAAWRPISEAPRDGTEVLLFDSRTNIQVVAGWEGPVHPDDAPVFGWRTLDGMGYMTLTFTHFRPIPPPPSTMKEKSDGHRSAG